MPRTPAAAIAASKSITVGYGGMCLAFVRTAFGVAPKYASAIAAWNAARYKHRTTNPNALPAGVPGFMTHPRSTYQHVFLSLGGGLMRTTNSITNRIQTVSIQSWLNNGWTLLGWTEDLNGVRVYTPPADDGVPGWWHVNTAKGENLNGREKPGLKGRIAVKRQRGFTIYATARKKVDGLWWVKAKTFWYAEKYLKRGKA